MTAFTESIVEEAALDWLVALDGSIAHGPEIAPDQPGAGRSPNSAPARCNLAHSRMPDRPLWTAAAWSDYGWWQGQDRKTLARINRLIQDAMRHPFEGIGKAEPLRENLSGFWSRRIDDAHRLVYTVEADTLVIIRLPLPLRLIRIPRERTQASVTRRPGKHLFTATSSRLRIQAHLPRSANRRA